MADKSGFGSFGSRLSYEPITHSIQPFSAPSGLSAALAQEAEQLTKGHDMSQVMQQFTAAMAKEDEDIAADQLDMPWKDVIDPEGDY